MRLVFVLLSFVLSLVPTSTHAWVDWPGEWQSGRPTLTPAPIELPDFRLEVPFRTQKDGGRWQNSNCGPAILGMVLDGFGISGQAVAFGGSESPTLRVWQPGR